MPNYIGHLLGTAQVAFSNDHPSRYAKTVDDDDVTCLREYATLLQWGSGEQGTLTPFFVFFPGYLGLEDGRQITQYFTALQRAIRENNLSPLFHSFPALRNLADWMYSYPEDCPVPTGLRENQSAVSRLSDVWIDNYGAFRTQVWPTELPNLQSRADEMNAVLSARDVIGDWERLTGCCFLYPQYTFVLSIGIENGPNFNSLGYEKNWVWWRTELLFEGIVHEVGTHLLISLFKSGWSAYSARIAYDAYETLCDFYCELILASYGINHTLLKTASVFSPAARSHIEQLWKDDPAQPPERLYAKVLDRLSR